MTIHSRGSAAWRAAHWGPGCDRRQLVTAHWMAGVGRITCDSRALGAFRALGRIFQRHGYPVRSEVTGCYNCRAITGGTVPSAHAQGIALDVCWDTNPYRRDRLVTDMPRAMVEDIEALRTRAGVNAFRWGGDWDGRPETPHSNYDAMHFEIIATPAELAVGFLCGSVIAADRRTWYLLGRGERGVAVQQLQTALGITADGIFGPATELAVNQYQASRGLPVDGLVGLGTWTALWTKQPPVDAIVPNPHKGQAKVIR